MKAINIKRERTKAEKRAAVRRSHIFEAVGIIIALAWLILGCVSPTSADGILIPGEVEQMRPTDPNFTVKYHRVTVSIDNQLATTEIDQEFLNRTDREMEATYVFPLPEGAVVRDFVMYDQGREVRTKLLKREEARRIYENIVRQRKDPGLLEYIGRNLYQASVFPVPAKGTKRVEMVYSELLRYDTGVVTYVYPLSTEKFSAEPIEEVLVDIKIHSDAPIRTVYSPSHEVKVTRQGEHDVRVRLEEHGTKPNQDLLLYYGVSQDKVGAHLLTHKEGNEDGFFLFMATPSDDLTDREIVPKDVVFVLDTSGSMSGEKIEQAKGALTFCINTLNAEDRFGLITFSSTVRNVTGGLQSASRENREKAKDFVAGLNATGGTDINSALSEALLGDLGGERAGYIVFLTDGLPTVGETDVDSILTNVYATNHLGAQNRSRKARLFAFGVGYDVDTHFLDKLTSENGGVSEYVRPSEDIEVKVSRFFAKVTQPLLTEVELDLGGVKTYDIFPIELPDLFVGSQLLVFGRYQTEEDLTTNVSLSGLSYLKQVVTAWPVVLRDWHMGRPSAAAAHAIKDIAVPLALLVSGGHPRETEIVTRVSLSGRASARRTVFTVPADFPKWEPRNPQIAPLWAARKIGYLLDEIRLHGESDELVDEIISLSLKYGILTEYTAFLAEESASLAPGEAREAANEAFRDARVQTRGSWAVSQAQNAQVMQKQTNLSAANQYLGREGEVQVISNVQMVKNQAFFNQAGNWVDARYREGEQKVIPVQAFSEAYFQLSRDFPELNQFLALGQNVLITMNGQAIQVSEEGKTSFTEEELEALRQQA